MRKGGDPSSQVEQQWFLGFRLEGLLGQGGLGVVHRIRYKGEPGALKRVKSQWANDPLHGRRLLREGELLVQLMDPNVVKVHETGVTPDGVVWLRMELLEGLSLRALLDRQRPLSPALACAYLAQAGYGAYAGHEQGIVHRDIKPENLFLTREYVIKLLDFGIARLAGSPDTLDHGTHGTPLYMAPEQIRRRDVTPAADVYPLGVIAYEAMAGTHPFVEDRAAYDVAQVFAQHLHEAPPPLTERGVPAAIAEVVAAALEKDPERRPKDGKAFATALLEAWAIEAERDPELDTRPGEPALDDVLKLLEELEIDVRRLRAAYGARRPARAPRPEPALVTTEPDRGAALALATTEISPATAAGLAVTQPASATIAALADTVPAPKSTVELLTEDAALDRTPEYVPEPAEHATPPGVAFGPRSADAEATQRVARPPRSPGARVHASLRVLAALPRRALASASPASMIRAVVVAGYAGVVVSLALGGVHLWRLRVAASAAASVSAPMPAPASAPVSETVSVPASAPVPASVPPSMPAPVSALASAPASAPASAIVPASTVSRPKAPASRPVVPQPVWRATPAPPPATAQARTDSPPAAPPRPNGIAAPGPVWPAPSSSGPPRPF